MTFINFNSLNNKIGSLLDKANPAGSMLLGQEKSSWQKRAEDFIKNTKSVDQKTAKIVNEWQQNFQTFHSSTKIEEPQEIHNQEALLKKAKRLKKAIKILSLTGLSLFFAGSFINFIPNHFSSFIAPHAIIPLTLASFGIMATGGLCLAAAGITHLCSRRIFRQKRVIKSVSFNEFAKKYIVKESFKPSQIALTDVKLHKIYLNWKKQVKPLVRLGKQLEASGIKL